MSPRFAYVYFMKDDLDRVRAVVPAHVSHLGRRFALTVTSAVRSKTGAAA